MLFRRFALLLVVVALVACNNEKNRNLIDRRTDQAVRMGQEAQKPAPKKSYNPLTVSDKVWSGNSSMRLRRGLPLPTKYENPRGVTLISSEAISLGEIATAISTQTGIPVRMSAGLGAGSEGGALGGTGSTEGKMPVAYEGPLSSLLDLVSGNFGINWKYDGSTIRLSRFETRVFTVEALPGTQTIKDGVKEESSGGGGGSSSASAGGSFSVGSSSSLQQSSEMSVELKVWDEINSTLTAMLGGVGSVVVSPSSGTATVTTTPEIMATVAKYVEEENRRLTRQIAINVEIYSVALEDEHDFSMTFTAALKKMGSIQGGLSTIASPLSNAAATNAGKLSVAIIDPSTWGTGTTVFSALSEVGDTTRVTQFPLTTLNNRTVSRRVGRDLTYVASLSESTSTSSSFASSTVTPGTIREGFSLQLTPRLLEDGRVMLQYSLSLVDIINLQDFDTGTGNVQLPETSSRVFVQQAMLRSGSTLVIGGHDDEAVSQSSRGMGNAYNYFLGGGSTNMKRRQMMFIAITPQIIDVGMKAEQE